MSDDEKYERYARKIRMFNGLKPEEVAFILRQGQVLQFFQGQTVFHEGALGRNIFVVLRGEVAIYKKGSCVAKCQIGDMFGEMSVLNHEPRCATAMAVTDVRLFTLDESQINGLLEKQVAVRVLLNIIHVLSERLEAANEWIAQHPA